MGRVGATLFFVGLLASSCRHAKKSTPADAAGPRVLRCDPSGCPIPTSPGPPHEGGELVLHVEAEPALLCDLVEHDIWSRWIVENQVAETLLFQDPASGAITPRLAERIEADPPVGDPRTLTLHLRSGVIWHDGQPFSAADVLFTLGLAKDPKVGADQHADLEPISEMSAPDGRTVLLKIGRPAPYLRQALAHIALLPAHLNRGQDLRRAATSRAPVGTGPFRFLRWDAGREIVLARNEQYWGKKPYLDRVVFRVVRDKQVAFELYRRGEIDVLWRLAPALESQVLGDPALAGHQLFVWTPRAYQFILWNTAKAPFSDPRVRRALGMLLDLPRYLQISARGLGRVVTGPYVHGSPSYDDRIAPLPYDPKRARALLDEAGVKGLHFTFLMTAGSRTVEQLATLLKEDLERAGIQMEIASVDFAVLLDRLRKHAFDATSLMWTLSLEQDNFSMFHSSQIDAGQNWGGFKDAEVDALLQTIRVTSDDSARHALDQKLHRLIAEAQPYTFLSAPPACSLERPRVHGLRPSTEGFNLTEAWVD